MSPFSHLVGSWMVGRCLTDNQRDCRLVALAGIAPDLDGLGLVSDLLTSHSAHPTYLYPEYHHFLFHGAFGAGVVAAFAGLLAVRHWRVAALSLLVFHLHLLCDFVGSRGPSITDKWPIFYLGPFTHQPMWVWSQQWALDAWPNRLIAVALFGAAMWMAVRGGHSPVGVFSPRADATFVQVLRGWRARLTGSSTGTSRL